MAKIIYKACVLNANPKTLCATRYVIFIEEDKKKVLVEFRNGLQTPVYGVSYSLVVKDSTGNVVETKQVQVEGQYAKTGETFGKSKIISVNPACEQIEVQNVKELKTKKASAAKVHDSSNKMWAVVGVFAILLLVITGAICSIYLPFYQQTEIWIGNNVGESTYYQGVTLQEVAVGKLYIQKVNSGYRSAIDYTTESHKVRGIKSEAFRNSYVPTVRIYNLDKVESLAFYNAVSLYSLDLEAKNIESKAIVSCGNLQSIILDTSKIKANTVESCANLKYVQIYNTKKIAANAFLGCTGITEVRFVHSKPTIEKGAFQYPSNITFYYEGQRIDYDSLVK